MNFKFQNRKITGILTVLPANVVRFEDEMEQYNFSVSKSQKLKLIMGYDKKRVVGDETCVSDLAIFGMQHLFSKGLLNKEDIDALLLVTQTPDHFMPPTSSIIHGKLNLKQDIFCMDVNQGCAGFIMGLFQAFMLLEQESVKKVVLINADVLSRKVSKRDRNSNPLVGDGATITIVERDPDGQTIYANLKMDGSGSGALIIPAGGFRIPSTSTTAEMVEDASGNFRSMDNLVMKGDEVFNFVQTEVPPMIENLLASAGSKKEEVDYFMFHQPNKFMLQKLADKMGVPHDKMPCNVVENFGNGSGISIPTVISHNLGDTLKSSNFTMCLAGFGVGLTWGSILMNLGGLDFCDITDYHAGVKADELPEENG